MADDLNAEEVIADLLRASAWTEVDTVVEHVGWPKDHARRYWLNEWERKPRPLPQADLRKLDLKGRQPPQPAQDKINSTPWADEAHDVLGDILEWLGLREEPPYTEESSSPQTPDTQSGQHEHMDTQPIRRTDNV